MNRLQKLKFITPSILALFFFSQNNLQAATQESPKAFVQELGRDVIAILKNKNARMTVRKANFRKEIREHFDLPSIGKFILARYWRNMSAAQRQEYIQLFEDAVIENYASQFSRFNNQQFIITGERKTQDDGTVIASQILSPGNPNPLNIHWKVFNTRRGLKVVDVLVENVSMSFTLRSEYSGVINSRGGNVDGLLIYLRDKIQSDREKNEAQ